MQKTPSPGWPLQPIVVFGLVPFRQLVRFGDELLHDARKAAKQARKAAQALLDH